MSMPNNKIEGGNNIEIREIAPEDEISSLLKTDVSHSNARHVAEKISNINLWISQRTGKYIPVEKFLEELPKGEILVEFVNTFVNPIKKIYRSQLKTYRHIDNIAVFLEWLKNINFPKNLHFDSVDLYEAKNIPNVIRCLLYLSNFLNQKKLGIPVSEEPFYSFTDEFINNVQKFLKTGYSVTISAIVNHTPSIYVEHENFFVQCKAVQPRFESWDAECYDMSPILKTNPSINDSKANLIDDLQELYSSENGRKFLEKTLLSNILYDIEYKYAGDSSFRFLEKYKAEIIKFPSIYINLHFGLIPEVCLPVPTEAILHDRPSNNHILYFISNILSIDSSDGFSLTLIPVGFFLKNSLDFKRLQNNISAITCDLGFSIDPISIFHEKCGNLLAEHYNYDREKILAHALDNSIVRLEFIKRIAFFKQEIDKICKLIENYDFPEYFNLFINHICKINNCSRKEAMGVHFDYLISPLFVLTETNWLPRELLKIIFQNSQVFTEICFYSSLKDTSLKFFRPIHSISSFDRFLISPLKEFIESQQIN